MQINFLFSSENNKNFATPQNGGTKFYVGSKVRYDGNWGLMNIKTSQNLLYNPDNYVNLFGFWAHFILPTAISESSGSFYCLNTYDRAKFTFGFMQYAAHVPDGDFVKFLRSLLTLQSAPDYFPRLVLANNRICFRKFPEDIPKPLESDSSTGALMDYFNPTLSGVEEQELICSARMVHWAMNDPDHRKVQIEIAINLAKSKMFEYSRQYGLDGAPDKICLVIFDIRHQGRARSSEIISALNTNGNTEKAFTNLINLGSGKYPERVSTLKSSIKKMIEGNNLGNKVYDEASKNFV